VMELLDGETLAAVLRRRKLLEVAETLAIVRPVAGALRAAHDQGIVHRDLKPDNIFLVQDGAGATRPRVLDFGVAKLLDPRHAGSIVTKAGSTLGTPAYMAPEQAAADPSIDQRADIWSLGVVIYECLAGARPVEVSSIGQLLRRVATEAITPLGMLAPDAPAELTGLVMDMLAPDRDDRPADMAGICDVLDRL